MFAGSRQYSFTRCEFPNVDKIKVDFVLMNSSVLLMGPFITKICLYNFDPLKPHFYIVKLGFTGVYIIFLFLLKNIGFGYSLEPPRQGGSNEYPQSMF